MKKSKNNVTGIVHGLSGRKIEPIQLLETVCGIASGIVWTKADDEDITCMKCRSMLVGKYPKYCCEKMEYYLNMKCYQHSNKFDCPDNVITHNKDTKSYGLIIHDGSSSYYKIFFCPWCGKKL